MKETEIDRDREGKIDRVHRKEQRKRGKGQRSGMVYWQTIKTEEERYRQREIDNVRKREQKRKNKEEEEENRPGGKYIGKLVDNRAEIDRKGKKYRSDMVHWQIIEFNRQRKREVPEIKLKRQKKELERKRYVHRLIQKQKRESNDNTEKNEEEEEEEVVVYWYIGIDYGRGWLMNISKSTISWGT